MSPMVRNTRSIDLFPGTDIPSVLDKELIYRREKTPDMGSLRETDQHLVFVYGSLMQGFNNNYLLAKAQFLGRGKTHEELFEMYSAGAFPVLRDLTDYNEGNFCYGEVYAVNAEQMMRLDFLESNGTMYTRKKKRIKLLDQKISVEGASTVAYPLESCWVYLGEDDYWDWHNLPEVRISTNGDQPAGIKWTKEVLKNTYN